MCHIHLGVSELDGWHDSHSKPQNNNSYKSVTQDSRCHVSSLTQKLKESLYTLTCNNHLQKDLPKTGFICLDIAIYLSSWRLALKIHQSIVLTNVSHFYIGWVVWYPFNLPKTKQFVKLLHPSTITIYHTSSLFLGSRVLKL